MNKTLTPLVLLSVFPLLASGASPVCSVTGGVMTVPSGSYCQGEPDYYSIKIYEMGLCPSAPTPPTTSSTMDLTGCEVVFTNASGFDVVVNKGTSSALSGTTTKPSNGTYNYGYIKLNRNFVIKAAITFSASVQDDPSGTEEDASDYSALGSGQYCVTTTATSSGTGANTGGGVDVTYQSSTVCSSDSNILSSPGTLTAPLDNLAGGSGFSATGTEGTVTAYLVDTSAYLATDEDDVYSVVGVQDFSSSPIVITSSSSIMDAQFTVSQGMSVSDVNGGSPTRIGIGNGPFQVSLTVE
ncbi:MAG: hypothetical protein ABW082_06075 [Sedimenticola sp.]